MGDMEKHNKRFEPWKEESFPLDKYESQKKREEANTAINKNKYENRDISDFGKQTTRFDTWEEAKAALDKYENQKKSDKNVFAHNTEKDSKNSMIWKTPPKLPTWDRDNVLQSYQKQKEFVDNWKLSYMDQKNKEAKQYEKLIDHFKQQSMHYNNEEYQNPNLNEESTNDWK